MESIFNMDDKDICVLPSRINRINGHVFKKTTFKRPTYCHHCSEFLWGLANQGMKCITCSFVSHEKCEPNVVTPCNAKATSFVQIPHTHILIRLVDDKKKICNVCRTKIDDFDGYECQVCSYYVHNTCKKRMVHNCKIYHCYCTYTGNFRCKQHHHWCEGHLPLNSICKVCQKPCSNLECLTGMRCSWCLTTVHSYCVTEYHPNCSFGMLRTVMLPPQIVKNYDLHSLRKDAPEKMSPSEEKKAMNAKDKVKSIRILQENSEEKCDSRDVRVYEHTTTADALADALEKFKINGEQLNYYLTKVGNGKTEIKLDEEERIWTYMNDDLSTCRIFLRNICLDSKKLNVTLYAGMINTDTKSVQLTINIMSKASEMIIDGLKQFKLPIENPEKYCITRMKVTPKTVREIRIENDQSIYEVLVLQRRLSIKELHNTRFYLQPKPDDITELLVFVSNLPVDLSKEEYKCCLREAMGSWDENMDIAATFPTFGSLVILFKRLETYIQYSPLLSNLSIDNKTLKTKLLPEIKEEFLPKTTFPLVVFVNCKSGGGQGEKIFVSFKRLLNPHQVVDIIEDGPLPILYMLRHLTKFRILVCGGDGTVGWVLSYLEEIRHRLLKCHEPPVGVLPLGTGNDMSRVLNWGAGYTGESLLDILKSIITATEVKLDRWNVLFDSSNHDETPGEPVTMQTLNNYFGVGMDALLSLEFHLSREENPEKFNSRLHNKGVYFKAGLKKLHSSCMTNLNERLSLQVDGKEIALPCIEGIAINNISSWAAGADPWGNDPDPNFKQQSFNDGLLEVLGFTGVYHMGKIKSGISTGIRLAQGNTINLQLKDELPVQVDGEPWMQPPCIVMIRPTLHQAVMLTKPCPSGRRYSTSTAPSSNMSNTSSDVKSGIATITQHSYSHERLNTPLSP